MAKPEGIEDVVSNAEIRRLFEPVIDRKLLLVYSRAMVRAKTIPDFLTSKEKDVLIGAGVLNEPVIRTADDEDGRWYTELFRLREAFGKDFGLSKTGLWWVRTPEVIFTKENGEKLNLGRFKIQISILCLLRGEESSAMQVIAETPVYPEQVSDSGDQRNKVTHPHIKGNMLCLGSAQYAANARLHEMSFGVVIDMVLNGLLQENYRSGHYANLEYWDPILCTQSGCGKKIEVPMTGRRPLTCYACGSQGCKDHLKVCNGCNTIQCVRHSNEGHRVYDFEDLTCMECSRPYCRKCKARSNCCGEAFCRYCYPLKWACRICKTYICDECIQMVKCAYCGNREVCKKCVLAKSMEQARDAGWKCRCGTDWDGLCGATCNKCKVRVCTRCYVAGTKKCQECLNVEKEKEKTEKENRNENLDG